MSGFVMANKNAKQITVDLTGLGSGSYLCALQVDGQAIDFKKLFIVHH